MTRFALALAVIFSSAVVLPACSKLGDANKLKELKETAAALDAAPPEEPVSGTIVVESAATGVVIDNRVGRRLLNVRIKIEVKESAVPFILVLPTIDKDTKTVFEFGRFRSEEATLLDPMMMHMTQINVTARDTFSKAHETTVPWTPTP